MEYIEMNQDGQNKFFLHSKFKSLLGFKVKNLTFYITYSENSDVHAYYPKLDRFKLNFGFTQVLNKLNKINF